MALVLYYHPLASFCWKVLIPLYENGTPFEPRLVDFSDERQREEFSKLSPHGKFPLLHDEQTGRIVPESSIIIEYLAQRYPGPLSLIPADADEALEARLQDRFFDQQLHEPMQKHVLDKLRPEGKRDPFGVEQAHAQIEHAYELLEITLKSREFAAGSAFTIADCAASPALYYANRVHPIGPQYAGVAAYLERLKSRPAFARVLREAEPYFSNFPG